MKQTTRKPESRDENPRNRNPANPKAIAMSAWTQNPFDAVHVSILFSAFARAVPAEFADRRRYANTYTIIALNLFQFNLVIIKKRKKKKSRERERERGNVNFTWSWPKSNQTCKISGKRVAPLDISQTEATISNREYTATIAFAANTNLHRYKQIKTCLLPEKVQEN